MDNVRDADSAHVDDKLKQIQSEVGDKAPKPSELEKSIFEKQKFSDASIPSTNRTSLLPPFLAVYNVWALTSKFDKTGSAAGSWAADALTQLKDQAIKAGGMESQYFFRAITLMDASFRNLEIIYKGRELNFEENGQLRQAFLNSVTESVNFGQSANDLLKSLPTMTFTGAAGSLVVSQAINLTSFQIAMAVMGFAAIGFLFNLYWVRHTQNKKLNTYVRQDYERSMYYEHYLHRTKRALTDLYKDLNRLHEIVFLTPYATTAEETKELEDISKLIDEVEPHACPNFHKHMAMGLCSSDLWSRCETGWMYEECPNKNT